MSEPDLAPGHSAFSRSPSRRTIRTAIGAEAAATVFASAYAATLRQTTSSHTDGLLQAREAVEKFLDVLDQDISNLEPCRHSA